MDNGDATQGHAMTPEEFAKLMGAYPQPAENPLPTYGGYMDNSPANFSFVEFNDYFGAETFEARDGELKTLYAYIEFLEKKFGNHYEEFVELGLDPYQTKEAETFESPYAGAGSLFGIKQDTGLEGFTTSELTTSSAIHGDFDEASLNYSGHQNFEVRAEGDLQGYSESQYPDEGYIYADTRKGVTFVEGAFEVVEERENREDEAVMVKFELPIQSFIRRLGDSITIDRDIYDAEMEMIDDSIARIKNRFGDDIGMVSVDDHDVEDAVVEVSDGSDIIQEVIISEAETKKSSILPFVIGGVAAVFAFPKVTDFFTKKEEKAADTPEMEEIELIENPNTGNLDPAQYEEMVVESTGFAVDVIPQVLDGSFMGSRFQALPTERYVEYNEPGIGAHTDIALNRDEIFLEPEMAMVQASENVIKESQAPGQSPYNSTTGEENPDFDMRVLKETQVISLDPAAKPFIPQSMSGYTGNANTPPSVLNKMFNTGVLGQTPAFVPGSGDMGANHLGSRNATPNTLGLGGSVGGPLSDQVNANYTDGTTSMSLAQWSIENTVSQTSDTEAVVIDRSSGLMKRVRRV
tara:strand:+ start:1875 stop:3605 length:1731 start_codon:yes stop_codon:yes gene_type:complete